MDEDDNSKIERIEGNIDNENKEYENDNEYDNENENENENDNEVGEEIERENEEEKQIKKSYISKRGYEEGSDKKIPFDKILSFKPKLLNNFMTFCSTDDLFELLQLNQKSNNILLKTNLFKAYMNVRKEFTIFIQEKNPNYREMILKAKTKQDLKGIFSTKEKKVNFDKYNLSQLLRKNCEIIKKIKMKLKLTKSETISIFSPIIERQMRKEMTDEIDISNYNLDNEGIAMINYVLSNYEGLKKIKLANNSQIKSLTLINNVINKNRSDLQILNLSYNNLDDKCGILIFDYLQNYCPEIKIINLSGNNLTNRTFSSPKLKEAFSNDKFLFIKKFLISHNLLGSKGAVSLFELLINCKLLNLLDISYNGIEQNVFDSEITMTFFDPQKSQINFLYTFYYEGNFLPSSETENLFQCLSNNSILKYLYLGNNQMNDESMESIYYYFVKNSNLFSLHLNYNNFTIKGFKLLSTSIIEKKCRVIELNLSNNKINPKILKLLLDSISKSTHIHSLNLSYNDFSKSVNSDLIAKYIENDPKIKNLNLSACHLGLGCKKIMSVMDKSKKINSLDLSVNDIGGNKDIFDSLSNYLKINFYIKFLFLDGNFINDKDFEKLIFEGIRYNRNLNILSLRSNRITLDKIDNKDTKKNLIEAIKINNYIRDIRLDGNPIKNKTNLNLINEALEKNGTLENREYILKILG